MAGSSFDGRSLICAKHSTVAHTGEQISAPRQRGRRAAGRCNCLRRSLHAGCAPRLALKGARKRKHMQSRRVRALHQCPRPIFSFFPPGSRTGMPTSRQDAAKASWPGEVAVEGWASGKARRRHWRPGFSPAAHLAQCHGFARVLAGLGRTQGRHRSGCGQAFNVDHFAVAADAKDRLRAVLLEGRRRPPGPPKKSRRHA